MPPPSQDVTVKNVSLSYKEGRFFDLWMLPHVLTGVAGGASNVFFDLSALAVFGLGFALMVVWELVELMVGIREVWENRLIDVVVGMLGVAAAIGLGSVLGRRGRLVFFGVSAAAMIVTGFLGWRAARTRKRAVRKGDQTG